MSDFIRREDVLDAIQKRADEVDSVYSAFWEGLKIAQDIVEKVPSAEPERQDFEWCHDCKEYDQEKHCCNRWTKVIRQSVEEVKNSQWIPVSEKLPNPWVEVLTTYEYKGKRFVQTAEYAGQNDENGHPLFCAYSDEFAPDHYNFVYVAWMPLPEPWRGER